MRETVAPALAELGVAPAEVREVIVSHADVDHYGGNAEARELFGEARLRAHALDRPSIESGTGSPPSATAGIAPMASTTRP